MAITGIPPYDHKTPLALFINCHRCLKRYLVWTADQDPAAVEPLGDYTLVDSCKLYCTPSGASLRSITPSTKAS